MSRKYTIRSKEEKPAVAKEVLAGRSTCAWEPEISNRSARVWVKKPQAEGETGPEPKKHPGDPPVRYKRRRELSRTEQLRCQIELLKREPSEKEAEAARLKQGTIFNADTSLSFSQCCRSIFCTS